nr:hypothetical protein [Caballeronia terrestris]
MKREHGASEGGELHRLLNQCREAIDARAKVNRFAVQVDRKVGIKAEHQRSSSAAINAVTSVASVPGALKFDCYSIWQVRGKACGWSRHSR